MRAGEDGTSAAEFALLLPALLLFTIGTTFLCILLYAVATLNWAVEKTARCVAYSPTVCTAVQTYGTSQYVGPSLSPTFTLDTTQTCGNLVTATATYSLEPGLGSISVPL